MPLRSAGIGVGENISPPLSWSGVPAATAELAILMEDPDAPLPRPFVHMITYRISPDKSGLAERARGSDGANGFSNAESDPRRQNIRKRWVQAPAHASRTAERKTARTHPVAKALRTLAWGYWNPCARKSAYALGVLHLNL